MMRERILIAEDSATQREALVALLEEQGFQVTAAADGEQALARAHERSFDLVITDIVMPGMDGFELCQRLKSELRAECPAIMLLTSLSNATDIIRGLESGADNFLTKPYEADQLISRIQFVIANRRLREKARAEMGIVIHFLGKTFTITSERQQILDLLLTTYEDAVLQNRRLREREEELRRASAELQDLYELRRQAEEAVRRAHETLLAAVGEGVQVHDAEGRITSINESALRILGRTREDVAAGLLRSWDIVSEDGTPFPTDAYPVARTLRTGESVSGVVMGVRRPDGGVAWLKVSSRPLLRPGETKPYGAVATFADVTAYKETVEQLAAMTQQLWQTARLATMGELAASVAHELNNPLATVNLRVESLLAQVPADDPKRRALEVIEQEAERMGNLVAGLLQFSRRSHRQVSTLDLRDEVKASLDLVHYHLRNRRVAVELDGAADVALVHADRQQLRQLFLNLFTNASDAMPEGGRLRIRVTHGNGNVVVEVADTGVGISAENMERIFEPFFTTKPEGKGTGLGLAICRRIAQEHGGTLDLTSEVGKGTTVRITLPAASAEGESK
jgi:PAS domain S-box-containing protein